MNKEKIEQIFYEFGGVGLFCDNKTKLLIVETLSRFSEKDINHITQNCWFVSSSKEYWAFNVNKRHLPEHLIFLNPDLLKKPKAEVQLTIAHEIAHVLLGHKSPILDKLTKEETERQEKEAIAYAKKALK